MIKYSLLQAKLNIAKEINIVVGRRGRSFRATEAKAAAAGQLYQISIVFGNGTIFSILRPSSYTRDDVTCLLRFIYCVSSSSSSVCAALLSWFNCRIIVEEEEKVLPFWKQQQQQQN